MADRAGQGPGVSPASLTTAQAEALRELGELVVDGRLAVRVTALIGPDGPVG